MKQLVDFTGKHVIVFGASSGIGQQTAVTLSALGASLTLVARRAQQLSETAALCTGGEVRCMPFDLRDTEGIGSLVAGAVQSGGVLHGMVYAAGICADAPLRISDRNRLLDTFDINYFPFMECVRQTAKRGRYAEGLRIVGISSVASLIGEKAHTAYAASKAAMDASVRVAAKELAAKGICINTVAPGMTMTKMTQDFIDMNEGSSDAFARTMQRQYLGMCDPQDVANAVSFLLSDAARMITGITLPVDGGFSTSC